MQGLIEEVPWLWSIEKNDCLAVGDRKIKFKCKLLMWIINF